jgi:hypothetical protein
MGKLEQLSIGAGDKKRDFSRNSVFHRGNFLELWREKRGEMR